jgi:hypothetical protein
VLSNPGDGTTGLVVLENKSGKDTNFAFLCSPFLRNEATVKMGEEEPRYVEDLKLGKHPDALARGSLARGSRAFFEVGDGSALMPSLAAVVDIAREKKLSH